MLAWLARKFEKSRSGLQIRLEKSLQARVASTASVEPVDWRKMGNEFLNKEMLVDAEACFRKGILADTLDGVCYSNLGYVLVGQGRLEEAERMLGHAIELNPADADAYYLRGNLARDRREWVPACTLYRAALSINPHFSHCRRDLCLVLAQTGQFKEAHEVLNQGPAFDPVTPQYHYFKGSLHLCEDQLDAAIASFQAAKQLNPKDPTILASLCMAQVKRGDVFSALQTGHQILEIQPGNAQAYDQMAVAYQFTGQHDLAIQYFRKALQLNPQYLNVHQNLIFALSYLQGYSPSDYLLEAQTCAATIRARARPYITWLCTDRSSKQRPLRVGFVSGDLRYHPVSMFLDNVLPFLDPEKITCIAYSNSATEDPYTAHLKPIFSEWTKVVSMPDDELACKIHDDCIDVLLDLSGHTGQNRLAVFAWRPAPIQVAWLGYWASTGLAEMDYILVDKVSVREVEAKFYSEKLWFLPDARLCFCPPVTDGPIVAGVTPAMHNGYITFGSFQSLSKVTDAALIVWSQILARLPSARLRLQSMPLSFSECASDLRRRLHSANIDLDRVDLFGSTSRDEYLGAYSEVDLVLDTFPFPGGTTTAEALWMGVPTVTLSGQNLLSRQGQSMMCSVGLADWVAEDEPHYIQLALQKAADLPRLNELRTSLRNIALASPLFDGAAFAKNLTDALEHMAEK
jgi:protein O-GlcNAc transferase